ncbi:hypothetical protein [Vineibacter terrae]|uniref:hypothetical protein n=1 Tax=Vineibacter terrae TaxID=2586908 RepID=UPI002E32C36A|nr:hypothetical protein [Vineibacter terrae]HEX2888397.1 hypothetical protein [Vineibacter terrae]
MARTDLPEQHSMGEEGDDDPSSTAWELADYVEALSGPLIVVLLIAVLVLA